MADEVKKSIKDEMNSTPSCIPAKWNRFTVADGDWMQAKTMNQLMNRDDFLADKIGEGNSAWKDALSSESATRYSDDQYLSASISSLSGEFYTFSADDYYPTVTALRYDLNSEIDRAIQAETTLSGRISLEETTRSAADTKLQKQIDELQAATDVIAVFGTYNEFVAGSGDLGVTDNDTIKVLRDYNYIPPSADEDYDEEQQYDDDGFQVYYEWHDPDAEKQHTDWTGWSAIGSLDPYYSVAEIDEYLDQINNEFDSLSATVANNYLSANENAVSAGKNIQIIYDENKPKITINTKADVEFNNVSSKNVSATNVTALTAQGNSANFTTGNFTNLTSTNVTATNVNSTNVTATNVIATNIQGTQANYTNFSGSYLTGVNGNNTVTATVSGLINSAANGGSMTAIKNVSGIKLGWDENKIFKFTTSADLLNLYVSGGAAEWIGFDIDRMNNAITVTGNLSPILENYLPVNWSGYTDSLFSGTSRSAQNAYSSQFAGSAETAYIASLAGSATNSYVAQNVGNVGSAALIGSAQSGKAAWNILSGTYYSAAGTALNDVQVGNLSAGFRISAGKNLTISTSTNTIKLDAKDTGLTSISAGGNINQTATYNSNLKLSAGDGITFVTASNNVLGISAKSDYIDYRGGNCIVIEPTVDENIKYIDLSSTVSCVNLLASSNSALWQNGDSYISARGGIVKLGMDSNQSVTYFDGMQVSHNDEATTTTWEKIINAGNGIFNEISANQLTMSGTFEGTQHSAYYTGSGINLKAAGHPGPNTYISPYDVSTVVYVDNQPVTMSARWYDLISGRNYVSAMGNGLPMIFSAVNTLPTSLEAGIYYLV